MGRPLSTSSWSRISLWHETAGDDWTPRPRCPATPTWTSPVGAGLTGLWTAHYLAEADPSLRIAQLEAEVAGYGASGRNGAGARHCSRLAHASRRGWPTGRRPWPSTGRCATPSTRSRDRRRGHRRTRRQGRDDLAGPQPGACGARARWRTPGPGGATSPPTYASWTRPRPADPRRRRHARRHVHPTAMAAPGRLVRGLASAVERRGCGSTSRRGSADRARPCGRRTGPCVPRP